MNSWHSVCGHGHSDTQWPRLCVALCLASRPLSLTMPDCVAVHVLWDVGKQSEKTASLAVSILAISTHFSISHTLQIWDGNYRNATSLGGVQNPRQPLLSLLPLDSVMSDV